jgi:hypothetical protein
MSNADLNPHLIFPKKAYSPSEPHIANLNPSRPNNNPEGEAKCYSRRRDLETEQRDRDDMRECRRWSAGSVKPTPVCVGFQPDLERLSMFSAGSGEVVYVSGQIRRSCLGFRPDPTETHTRHLSLAGYREIRPEYHVFRPVLSSSIFLCRRSVCMGDGSLFLSLFLRRRPDLSSSLLLCRQLGYEPFEYQKTNSDHINLF